MHNRLFWRFFIPLALLVGAGMLLWGRYSLDQTRKSLEYSLTENGLSQTHLIAVILQGQLIAQASQTDIEAALSNAAAIFPEVTITILTTDGQLVATNQPDFDNFSLNQPEIQQAILSGQGAQIRPVTPDADEERLFIGWLSPDQAASGRILHTSFSLAFTETVLKEMQSAWIIALILAIVIASGLAFGLSELVNKPLRAMNHAAERLLAAEKQPGAEPARDEFTKLSQIFSDINQRVIGTSVALLGEQQKLRAILDAINEGILIVDQQGLIQVINQALCDLFELTPDQALHRSIAEGLRDYRLVQLWEDSLHSQKIQAALLDFRKPNLYLQCSALPLASTPEGWVLMIFLDLTRLQRLETVRKDFVSNISHELRTPLASLKALTDTLLEGALEDPPAAKRFINRINIEVDALSQMVAELLELSRIESGRVPLEMRPIHPKGLLLPAFDRMAVQAEREELLIEVNCPDELPLVLADPPRMQQVLVNLIHNAIKFSNPGGRINLNAWQEGDRILFSVSDTGVGIPAEDLPRIFERFFKSDRARASGGTGLGLAISRHLVEAHDGRIWAESIETRGSTFTFSLPVSR